MQGDETKAIQEIIVASFDALKLLAAKPLFQNDCKWVFECQTIWFSAWSYKGENSLEPQIKEDSNSSSFQKLS